MMTELTGTEMVKRLFSRGESFDAAGFAAFFTETPVYQFGNYPMCLDRSAIERSANAFFSQITAVYHDIKSMVEIDNTVFVEMDVLYWRPDGSMIALPCADIFRFEGEHFTELRIFMDVNPVSEPAITVAPDVSVFTGATGTRQPSGDVMKRHYAEHPDGTDRVRNGFAPKWSLAGPRWAIA